ncbi:hypothetical protein AR457_33940 [Streptomyces agglomeratus]|uniref:Uncharacterized protein n=1 Tax=Streptomyces agglomeratus TaxID=285458 RepID=A0A1E5PH82_9ACTN|nr:hypothetical protein AS594_35050 [Streptomyces agglomeratus]OEJ37038.1 hypothetical protein BGK70_01435 [Streptomyces agglomeratus]OEJ48392.1 hypothetical protein AR457_33940 [Streptomyces agglomeratus]OEJ56895.1 hypothetical protein BGM19_01455 [Streptomyces agglomeratus]
MNLHLLGGEQVERDPKGAVFDRITVTAGAGDMSTAWWQQLASRGRIVGPLRRHDRDLTNPGDKRQHAPSS